METYESRQEQFEQHAELLKALAHPVRLCIVQGLLDTGGCNVSKIQGCVNVPQSTVSQHLAKLKSAGIIRGRRFGLEIEYQVVNKQAKEIVELLLRQ